MTMGIKSVKKFVVQKHTKAGQIHWDLMLEADGVLETYRLDLPPEKLFYNSTNAVKIHDHPLKFLTYEGSVNKGKGTVEIAESGTYQQLNKTEYQQQFQLDGKILHGNFALTHIADDKWELSHAESITAQ